MTKILFVDDENDYCLFMKEVLTHQGYDVLIANSALDGLAKFKESVIDLVITDVQMGTVDGLYFSELLKEMVPNIKIIILTNSDDPEIEYAGLNLDVNEFIKKTTPLKILLKRISRTLVTTTNPKVLTLESKMEEILVDTKRRTVLKQGEEIELTNKEFELLSLFLKNKNTVLSRNRIIREVWQTDQAIVESRVIDNHIRKLRAKLYLTSIRSIRGVGYEWIE